MPIVRRPVDHQCELCQAPIPAGTIHAGPDPLDPGFVVQCPQCCGLELPPAEPEEQTPIQMGLLA